MTDKIETPRRPRILVTGSHKPGSADIYADAARRAGADVEAGYLPNVPDEGDIGFDGLILAGGCDVTPSVYGEETNGAVNCDIDRDMCENRLIRRFLEEKKPIFGICRGHQLLNTFFGGTLVQDLPAEPDHRTDDPSVQTYHNIRAEENSVLYDLYGSSFTVNSFHHQALKRVADCFKVTSRSSDGLNVAESIEHKSEAIYGVQFHPERMSAPAVDGDAIFYWFINLCRSFME